MRWLHVCHSTIFMVVLCFSATDVLAQDVTVSGPKRNNEPNKEVHSKKPERQKRRQPARPQREARPAHSDDYYLDLARRYLREYEGNKAEYALDKVSDRERIDYLLLSGDCNYIYNYYSNHRWYDEAAYKGSAEGMEKSHGFFRISFSWTYSSSGKTEGDKYNNQALDSIRPDEERFRLFKQGADLNSLYASYNLGKSYLYGIGTKIDFSKAAECFQKAITVDIIKTGCLNYLGWLYAMGLGVEKNPSRAFEYFKEDNSVIGLVNQAICYDYGIGTDKSPMEAMRRYVGVLNYMTLNDNIFGVHTYEFLDFSVMRYLELSKSTKVEDSWFKGAFFYNLYSACMRKSNLDYLSQADKQKYRDLAEGNLEKAATFDEIGRNTEICKRHIGDYFKEKKQYAEAFTMYQSAAAQGDELSLRNLGYFYEHGLGVAKNLRAAKEWYQKALDRGYSYAKDDLNRLVGLGVR